MEDVGKEVWLERKEKSVGRLIKQDWYDWCQTVKRFYREESQRKIKNKEKRQKWAKEEAERKKTPLKFVGDTEQTVKTLMSPRLGKKEIQNNVTKKGNKGAQGKLEVNLDAIDRVDVNEEVEVQCRNQDGPRGATSVRGVIGAKDSAGKEVPQKQSALEVVTRVQEHGELSEDDSDYENYMNGVRPRYPTKRRTHSRKHSTLEEKTEMKEELVESSKVGRRNISEKEKHSPLEERTFALGELVYLKKMSVKTGISKKRTEPWIGPYRIIEVVDSVTYRIKRVGCWVEEVVHVNRLKEYRGRKDDDDHLEVEVPSDEEIADENEEEIEIEDEEVGNRNPVLLPQWWPMARHQEVVGERAKEEEIGEETEEDAEVEIPVPLRRSTRVRRPPQRYNW